MYSELRRKLGEVGRTDGGGRRDGRVVGRPPVDRGVTCRWVSAAVADPAMGTPLGMDTSGWEVGASR